MIKLKISFVGKAGFARAAHTLRYLAVLRRFELARNKQNRITVGKPKIFRQAEAGVSYAGL